MTVEIDIPINVDNASSAETNNHNRSNNYFSEKIGADEIVDGDAVPDSSVKECFTPAQDEFKEKQIMTNTKTKEQRLYDSELEDNGVKQILESLTEEEKEIMPDENEPMRHLRAERCNVKKAIKKIKYALKWRKDFGVSKLTNAFYEDLSSASPDPELATTRAFLIEESRTGKAYVRGYDRSGRAIFYMHPRHENSENEEYNMRNTVYQLERACACSAKNGYEKMVILIDFHKWTMKVAPSMAVTKKFLHILQECYPERCFRIYVCNAPLVFRIFWNLVQPFIDPITKTKIVFCASKSGKKILNNDLDLTKVEKGPGGTGELREFDAEEYLRSPMHLSFDEKPGDSFQ